MELNEDYEGKVFNLCMNIWEQIDKAPAVSVNAFKFIVKIAKKHRELAKEISFLTQDHYLESLFCSARHSVIKMMKDFTHRSIK